MNNSVKRVVRGGIIAALYAGITVLLAPISFGSVQARVSEALTLLPFIMPEAIPGLTVGCLIANIFGGSVMDMIFGTLATLAAAILTSKIKNMWLCPIPVILLNGIIVGAVLTFTTVEASLKVFLFNAASIAVSEAIICYCLGEPLLLFIGGLSKKIPFLR